MSDQTIEQRLEGIPQKVIAYPLGISGTFEDTITSQDRRINEIIDYLTQLASKENK